MPLSRRTHVLLDERRYRLLRSRARERGASMATLIRDAIDRTYGSGPDADAATSREQALESFLAAEPMPVEDWPGLERELDSLRDRSDPA